MTDVDVGETMDDLVSRVAARARADAEEQYKQAAMNVINSLRQYVNAPSSVQDDMQKVRTTLGSGVSPQTYIQTWQEHHFVMRDTALLALCGTYIERDDRTRASIRNEFLDVLLNNNVDVNFPAPSSTPEEVEDIHRPYRSPLLRALSYNAHRDMAVWLINHGATFLSSPTYRTLPLLHVFNPILQYNFPEEEAVISIVTAMIARGLDVNISFQVNDIITNIPLMNYALLKKCPATAMMLMDRGADTTRTTTRTPTPTDNRRVITALQHAEAGLQYAQSFQEAGERGYGPRPDLRWNVAKHEEVIRRLDPHRVDPRPHRGWVRVAVIGFFVLLGIAALIVPLALFMIRRHQTRDVHHHTTRSTPRRRHA